MLRFNDGDGWVINCSSAGTRRWADQRVLPPAAELPEDDPGRNRGAVASPRLAFTAAAPFWK
jgi:hypothetical protein